MECLGIRSGTGNNLDGNPIDLAMQLGLMIGAVLILNRRAFSWGGFISQNKLLIVTYGFIMLSSVWADNSFPTFKRAIKDFGSVLVALVFLIERDPMDAIRTAYVRIAMVTFPLSVVFIKYFPEIGRRPSRAGDAMFNGVGWHKSNLGALVFLFGLFVVIDLLALRKAGADRIHRWIRYGLLAQGAWLCYTCGSATSLICFTIGCFLLWGCARLVRLANPALMVFRCLAFGATLFVLEKTFDLSGVILTSLGKSKDLTGRTEIWEMVENANIPFLTGTGYWSFWHTKEATAIQEAFVEMNSAHNGFLDMYLDTGMIGLSLLIALVLLWGGRALKRMLGGSLFGRVSFVIWVLALFYNNSETAFFRLDPVWFTLLVMSMNCPPVFGQTEETEAKAGTELGPEPTLQAA
jgi:exopolysaccharide production protein ExoQ